MFNLLVSAYPLSQISADGALEDLHHEGEQRARQSGIPPALGLFVADECMLGLYFQELLALSAKSILKQDSEDTHRDRNIGIFQRLANKVPTLTRDMGVLYQSYRYCSALGLRLMLTCLPKTICKVKGLLDMLK